MKVVLPVMFFCLFTVFAGARPDNRAGNNSSSKKSGTKDLMLRIPSPETINNTPGDSLKQGQQPPSRLPEVQPDQRLAERPAGGMPIIRSPKGHFPPMPVYKPDTAVHYTLKIKKMRK